MTFPNSNFRISIVFGKNNFVSLGYTTSVSNYSSNGIYWNTGTLPATGSWYSVTYGSGMFVAVQSAGGTTSLYSYDGITWTSFNLSYGGSAVTYGNGSFVAVNGSGSSNYFAQTALTPVAYGIYNGATTTH